MPSSIKPLHSLQAIVIVTPEPSTCDDLAKQLDTKGFDVSFVKDSSRALSITEMKPNHWRPSMFIVDLVMPGGSGFVLAKHLYEKFPEGKIPVILMSQHISSEDILEAQQIGVLALLQKPVQFEAIKNAIQKEKARRLKAEAAEMSFRINNE